MLASLESGSTQGSKNTKKLLVNKGHKTWRVSNALKIDWTVSNFSWGYRRVKCFSWLAASQRTGSHLRTQKSHETLRHFIHTISVSSAEVVCRANNQEVLSYCIISKSHPYRKTGPTQEFIPEPIHPHTSELSPSVTPSCHWPWQLYTLKPLQPTWYSLKHDITETFQSQAKSSRKP